MALIQSNTAIYKYIHIERQVKCTSQQTAISIFLQLPCRDTKQSKIWPCYFTTNTQGTKEIKIFQELNIVVSTLLFVIVPLSSC